MNKMKIILLSVTSIFLLNVLAFAQEDNKSLFKIERNKNANIVQYDLNYIDNEIDVKSPIDAYWMLYAVNGQRSELSTFDKKAYGFKATKKDYGYELVLKAVEDRPIKVYLAEGKAKAEIKINDTPAYLSKVYVFAKDGFMGIPKVSYYTLTGIDIKTGKEITEKIDVK